MSAPQQQEPNWAARLTQTKHGADWLTFMLMSDQSFEHYTGKYPSMLSQNLGPLLEIAEMFGVNLSADTAIENLRPETIMGILYSPNGNPPVIKEADFRKILTNYPDVVRSLLQPTEGQADPALEAAIDGLVQRVAPRISFRDAAIISGQTPQQVAAMDALFAGGAGQRMMDLPLGDITPETISQYLPTRPPATAHATQHETYDQRVLAFIGSLPAERAQSTDPNADPPEQITQADIRDQILDGVVANLNAAQDASASGWGSWVTDWDRDDISELVTPHLKEGETLDNIPVDRLVEVLGTAIDMKYPPADGSASAGRQIIDGIVQKIPEQMGATIAAQQASTYDPEEVVPRLLADPARAHRFLSVALSNDASRAQLQEIIGMQMDEIRGSLREQDLKLTTLVALLGDNTDLGPEISDMIEQQLGLNGWMDTIRGIFDMVIGFIRQIPGGYGQQFVASLGIDEAGTYDQSRRAGPGPEQAQPGLQGGQPTGDVAATPITVLQR